MIPFSCEPVFKSLPQFVHGPITIEQLDLAAKAPRTGCAPGLDQVTEAESLKLPELHAELLKVLNTVYVWHCA